MDQSSFCIMCLGTEMKMSHMTVEVITSYYELLSIDVKPAMKQMHACFECAYLLNKYHTFKKKCYKAFNILYTMKLDSFEVTKEHLKSIDRKENKLESTLTQCNIEFCNSDNPFGFGLVKTELLVNDSDNHSKFNNKESMLNSTEHDVEDDIYPLHALNIVEFNDKTIKDDTDSSVVSTEERSELQMANDSDIKVSKITLDTVSIKGENDNNCINSDKTSIELENQVGDKNITKSRKRKCETTNEENILRKQSQNKNNGNKALTKRVKATCSLNVNCDEKKESRRTSKQYTVRDSSAIDSRYFKEHMTTIFLSQADAKKELLLRKESRNYKMNPHKCDLCYRGFNSDSTYQTHMKKHSMEYGSLKCEICQQTFLLIRHMKRHHESCHKWKFICKLCPYICYNPGQAKGHCLTHKGMKFECKECGKTFRFSNSLANHNNKIHNTEVVCDLCGSIFAASKGLFFHKSLRHKTEINERLGPHCAECDVHFASEMAWKRHLVLCSRHQVQFGCSVCGERFQDSASLKDHSRSHLGEIPWWKKERKLPTQCKICDKMLPNMNQYEKHLAREHPLRKLFPHDDPEKDTKVFPKGSKGDPTKEKKLKTPKANVVCDVCGKMFEHQSSFLTHYRVHTGEKPYTCTECGRGFNDTYRLRVHRLLHSNTRAFECHECGKAFTDRPKLNKHVKTHLNIRPFKCTYCDKAFPYKCEMKMHIKYVHLKEPWPKRDRSKRKALKADAK